MHPELKRIIRFLLSGGTVFLFAFILNWTLVHWFYLSPLASYIISAIPIFLLSFFLQSRVVFRSEEIVLKTYLLFLGSVVISNFFGSLILLFFLKYTPYEASIFIALGSQSLISYVVLKKIVFR